MKLPKRKYYVLDIGNRVHEVDLFTWAQWFEEANRSVAFTEITSAITVSTVFLGVDHRYSGKGPPILFESMVFGGPLDDARERYCSWDDAETGHAMLVAKCRKAIGQKVVP